MLGGRKDSANPIQPILFKIAHNVQAFISQNNLCRNNFTFKNSTKISDSMNIFSYTFCFVLIRFGALFGVWSQNRCSVQNITSQWAFWDTNEDNRFNGCGWQDSKVRGCCYRHAILFKILPSVNRSTDLNELWAKCCM